MPDRLYRLPILICCDTCGQEFFGASGEAEARAHAARTFHQVRINALVRETLNEVSEGQVPTYESPLEVTALYRKQSRSAAIARLEGIFGVTP